MEIERKFLIKRENLPENLEQYPCKVMEQGVSVHRTGSADLANQMTTTISPISQRDCWQEEEYQSAADKRAYEHLKPKADGIVISKVRYVIPEKDGLSIELDVFKAPYEGLLLAEVEFPTEEAAHAYQPPKWFGRM